MHLGLPVICIVKTAENDVVSGNSGRTLHALTHRHHPHDYTPHTVVRTQAPGCFWRSRSEWDCQPVLSPCLAAGVLQLGACKTHTQREGAPDTKIVCVHMVPHRAAACAVGVGKTFVT